MKVKFIKRLGITTCDMTIGKIYKATKLTYLSHEADGFLVTDEDAIKLKDDVGDNVYTSMSSGFELVGDDNEQL